MRYVKIAATGVVVAAAVAAFGQLSDPVVEPIIGARSLALSADGSRLAFSYRGDLWVVDSDGGRAYPVTSHVALDDGPIWSPDGKWLAFASTRNGGTNTYVVPADGGEPRQMTWHGASPGDWSPDGKRIVFDSTMDKRYGGIYEIDVATGQISEVMIDMRSINRPRYSNDGQHIVYERMGFPWYRPRYFGSNAAEPWTVELATKATKKWRDDEFQHLWPAADGGKVYAVTAAELTPSSSKLGESIGKVVDNVKRTPNVYEITSNGSAKRLTDFVGGSARFLTMARRGGMSAFTHEGHVYTMARGRDAKKIEIIASADAKTNFIQHMVLTNGVSDGAMSPDGSQIAFVVNNELWLVPTKKGEGTNKDDARQLTDWPGLDQNPLWAPDGKHLFFTSDRDGAERLWRMEVASGKATALSMAGKDVNSLQLSPDGKHLYYMMRDDEAGGLYRVTVGGTSPEMVLNLPYSGGQTYSVSPDGKWLAYSDNTVGSLINAPSNINLFIMNIESKEKHQITRLAAQHTIPVWSPDGKYIYFRTNRGGSNAIYLFPLQPEPARPNDLKMEYKKPTGDLEIKIDFEDTDARVRQILAQSPSTAPVFNPANGDFYFRVGGNLWKSNYNGKSAKAITTGGVSQFAPSKDWSKMFVVRNGTLGTVNLKSNQFPVSTVAFRGEWERDRFGERKAALAQLWRSFNSRFYDPNMHGRDWAKIRERYEPLVSSVALNSEFATVLNMMTGELESSHSEIRGASDGGPSSRSAAHLGFTFDYSHTGSGIKVKDVPKRSPGTYKQTQIKPGEIVLKINGEEVTTNTALYRDVLIGENGRDLTLTVSPDGTRTSAREVKYRALSSGEFRGIYSRNRMERLQEYVERKSGGKLTYLHIAGMGGGNLTQFNYQAWEYIIGKKGVIIDVRNNGGGNIADSLVDMIEREPHAHYQYRDGRPAEAPGRSWNRPTAVLHDETSFSNAEMFPSAMKTRGLATLVGVQTPGYVIWTGGLRLVDGTNARMPGSASFRLDGTPMENLGQKPDIEVHITREQYFNGVDPQLDKAIEILMKEIE